MGPCPLGDSARYNLPSAIRRLFVLGLLCISLWLSLPCAARGACESTQINGYPCDSAKGQVTGGASCAGGARCRSNALAYWHITHSSLSSATAVDIHVRFKSASYQDNNVIQLWNWSTGTWTTKLVLPNSAVEKEAVIGNVTLSAFVRSSTIMIRAMIGIETGVDSADFCWFQAVSRSASAPTAQSPLNHASGISLTPQFQWIPSCGNSGQQIQLSTTASFSSPLWTQSLSSTATTCSYTGSLLSYSTTYYWRVGDRFGSTFVWHTGSPWDFTTVCRRTLSISSLNPTTGAQISLSPSDCGAVVTTPSTCTFACNTVVTLTAPVTPPGGSVFSKWQMDGIDLPGNPATVTMAANHTMTAVFLPTSMRTLFVESSNPTSGVLIAVAPNNCAPNTMTPLSCTYINGAIVSLTAPPTADGSTFQKWQRDGTDYSTSQTATVTMDASHVLTAVYSTPVTRSLAVGSVNPNSGVLVNLLPSNCNPNATTPLTCTYPVGTVVELEAPSTAGGNYFAKWTRDNADYSTMPTISLTMDGDYTMTAVYDPPPPGGTNVPLCESGGLISFNIVPSDPSLSSVLSTIKGQYQEVLTSDCYGPQSWEAGRPINDLSTMDPFHGYWLRTSSKNAGPIQVTGTLAPPSTPLSLCSGWNLIPYLPDFPDTLTHALMSITGQYIRLFGYECDKGWISWDVNRPATLNDITCMKPNHGYWININSDATLIYPSSGYACSLPTDCNFQSPPNWPYHMDVWSMSAHCQADLIPVGTTICAMDARGALCGTTTVTTEGQFLIHVMGDDPQTPLDEGARDGEAFTLLLSGLCPMLTPFAWVNGTSHQFDVTFPCTCPSPPPSRHSVDSRETLAASSPPVTMPPTAGANESTYPLSSVHGDLNADGVIDVMDVIAEIEYVFAGGPSANPEFIAEINGTDPIDVFDIVHLIDYAFSSGPPPLDYQEPIDSAEIVIGVDGNRYALDQVEFGLDSGLSVSVGDSLIGALGARKLGEIRVFAYFRIQVPDTTLAISALLGSGKVRYATPYRFVELEQQSCQTCGPTPGAAPSDPDYIDFVHDYFALARVPLMWNSVSGSDAVVIGVIDGSFDIRETKPGRELYGRVVSPCLGPQPPIGDLHGTKVCGVIGAAHDNALGVAGALRYCEIQYYDAPASSGRVDLNLAQEGLAYFTKLAREGRRVVVNMSFAMEFQDAGMVKQSLWDAVRGFSNANGLMIASAGNQGWKIAKLPGGCQQTYSDCETSDHCVFPASATEVLAVGSVDLADSRYGNSGCGGPSNYGMGVIASTHPARDIYGFNATENCFADWSNCGCTSLAAPVVTAIAAAVWCANPTLSAAEVKEALIASADKRYVNACDFGFGRVNAFRAIRYACGQEQHEDPIPGPPDGLEAQPGTSSVELSWNWTYFNYKGGYESDIEKFNVYRRDIVSGTTWRWTRITGTDGIRSKQYTDESVLPSTLYLYRVAAVDAAGQEGYLSAAVPATTLNSDAIALPLSSQVMDIWSEAAYCQFGPLPAGSRILAKNPRGTVCGVATVQAGGAYLLHVIGDDANTAADEGARRGEAMTLVLEGACQVVTPFTWSPFSSVSFDGGFPCTCGTPSPR